MRIRSFVCNRCKMTRQRIKMFSNFMIFLSFSLSRSIYLQMGFYYEFIIIHQRWHIIPPTIHQIASWIDSSMYHTIRSRKKSVKSKKIVNSKWYFAITWNACWCENICLCCPNTQPLGSTWCQAIYFVWHKVAVEMHCIHSNTTHSNASKALSL